MSHAGEGQPVQRQLGMWDAVAIIVGIVIGATIFKSPQLIMANVPSPAWGLAAWALGGVLALVGALCYAELASTYPKSGGDYVYLSRAFGSWCGFLFGWAQLAVILTGSIGIMGFVFGEYGVGILKPAGTASSAEAKQTEASLTPDQQKLLRELRQPARKATPEQIDALNSLSPELQEFLRQRRPPGTALTDEQIKGLQTLSSEQLVALREIKTAEQTAELWMAALAAGAVVVLTILNILGVVLGKWTQNLLSLAKVAGLVAIAVIGFQYGTHDVTAVAKEVDPKTVSFGLAMIFVLYAYGGWNDAAFVAAEVRRPRNIVAALILGVLLIMVVYLVVNVAYLRALGFEKTRDFSTILAIDVATLHPQYGNRAALVVGILVMISALSAMNGLIFTGSRVYSSLGSDHSLFAALGRWNPRLGSPVNALLIQAIICLLMIIGVGSQMGRNAIDWVMTELSMSSMPWANYEGGFSTLVSGTAPVFWGFFLLTGLSLFRLRQRDPAIERPFRVPLFPVVPLIFCGTCVYMLYSSLVYAKWISLIGAIPLAIGLPLYWLSKERPGLND